MDGEATQVEDFVAEGAALNCTRGLDAEQETAVEDWAGQWRRNKIAINFIHLPTTNLKVNTNRNTTYRPVFHNAKSDFRLLCQH